MMMMETQWFLLVWALLTRLIASKSFPNSNSSYLYVGGNFTSCDSSQFLCHNGECIPWNLQCDRSEDCEDASDEWPETCEDGSGFEGSGDNIDDCDASTHFLCDTGECIERSKICNGMYDCLSRSDEFNCPRIYSNDRKAKEGSASSKISRFTQIQLVLVVFLSRLLSL